MRKTVIATVIGTLFSPTLHAAAFDRTGQSISSFLQPGNYFEATLTVSDTTLKGQEAGTTNTDRMIDDIANTDYRPAAAFKLQLAPQFSFGLIYDQPFASDSEYSGNNSFTATPQDQVVLPGITTGSLAEATDGQIPEGQTLSQVNTQNLSWIMGYQPNKNWNVYAGPVYQTFKSDIQLRGATYSLYNGYNFQAEETGDWGWLAGFAYQIPEKAIRTSLTYRSAITHKINASEEAPLIDMLSTRSGRDYVGNYLQQLVALGQIAPEQQAAINSIVARLPSAGESGTTKFESPASLNLEFQTGLRPGTLLFSNVRWVNWDDFAFQPYRFGAISEIVGVLSTPSRPEGFNLVCYFHDQWSANLGIGQRFSSKWNGSASIGWDSGAGEYVSTGGPIKGYYNIGLGFQYSPATSYFISGGMKYTWLGDAKGQVGAQAGSQYYVSEFKDNHSIGYGLKIGYRF